MNLKQFDSCTLANQGVAMELKDLRTREGSGVFIKLLGMDSDEFRKVKAERARAAVEKATTAGAKVPTEEELDQIACESLAALTVGWWTVQADGTSKPALEEGDANVTFTTAEAARIYRMYPAIREQANQFIADRRNFLQP